MGRKAFLPDLASFLKSDQANGNRLKGGSTGEGETVEIRPSSSSLLVPEVQMSLLSSGPDEIWMLLRKSVPYFE